MNIRLMTISDYEEVYVLWLSCKNMGFNNIYDSKRGIEKYLKRNPTTCFVAVEEEKICGEFEILGKYAVFRKIYIRKCAVFLLKIHRKYA